MKLEGIISAMVTPMNADESINENELCRQVDRQVAAGVNAVFCLGTNGEFFALSNSEKKRVIDIVVERADGRVPVLAGTGCITTGETIEMTRYAKKAGVDVASVITPYFAGLSQQGIQLHYSKLAAACDMPIVIYNIPMRTGVNVEVETLKELSRIPNIIGIKDSSGIFENTLGYIDATSEKFIVLCGNDGLILRTLQAGGSGGISGITNIFPEIMVSIYRYFKAGEAEKAAAAQESIATIRSTLKLHNPNSVVKRATNLRGFPVGPAREPFEIHSDEIDEKIKEALKYYEK